MKKEAEDRNQKKIQESKYLENTSLMELIWSRICKLENDINAKLSAKYLCFREKMPVHVDPHQVGSVPGQGGLASPACWGREVTHWLGPSQEAVNQGVIKATIGVRNFHLVYKNKN